MRRRALLASLLLLAVTGCSSGTSGTATAPSSTPSASRLSYVALGDSYTAAPYVYLTDVAGGCLRSDHNYPALLAAQLKADLTDVSCSAADTSNLTQRQQTFDGPVAPQLDAVGSGTDLVTLSMGGNDFGLFASLVRGCPITGPNGSTFGLGGGAACGTVDLAAAKTDIAQVGVRLRTALGEIKERAPHAEVVLVGYPRIASSGEQCPAQLPISRADGAAIDRVTRLLSVTMQDAAQQAGVRFVDMYAPSRGHDVCAGGQAWVNGIHTDTQRAAPLHPFLVEQRAVAARIADLLH